jgi:hypothetical protein
MGDFMKYQMTVIMTLALSLSAFSSAMADDSGTGKGQAQPQGQMITLTWDQFKTQCADPDSTATQLTPKNIEIQCTDSTRQFVADSSGSVPLAATRNVTTALSSNKFQVESVTNAVQEAADSGSCLRYKEVEQSFSIQKSLSCADILSIKGDISDYCAEQTELVKGANPKVVNVRDTGAVIDTCSGLSNQGGGTGAGK